MADQMTEERRAALRALCDTVVPSIERESDPTGFWGRRATDVGVDAAIEDALPALPDDQRDGLLQLLDGLAAQGITQLSLASREQLLRNTMYLGSATAVGVRSIIATILYLSYGLPDAGGTNPFWAGLAYPGPPGAPAQTPKRIVPLVPEQDEITLDADVCVIGSGAGGGVIAGVLAKAGSKVIVLEAGGYADDADFLGLELPAFQDCYWRGAPTPTADRNVTLQAGATLGGGTTINWTNCLRTTDWVREEWATIHGLEGVDGPEFDRHLDVVMERVTANDQCSDFNGAHQRMSGGSEALGWDLKKTFRNTDPATYDPVSAGHMGFGDQSGSKQSTVKTWLVDAAEHGAELLVHTSATRVIVEDGRAAGVEALYTDPADGRSSKVTVRAARVVVACGSLESPALLQRSGIGGPAVGRHLRLHPCTAIFGIYDEDQRGWWGAPQAAVVEEFADVEDGFGFLIESVQYTTGLGASALPWRSAVQHKDLMSRFSNGVSFIGLLRDRGSGQVTIDGSGQALPTYSLTDELDVRNTHRAIDSIVRLHVAAGAREITGMAATLPQWRVGDDVDLFIERLQEIPLRAGGWQLFSAHQMGTCRMGSDPSDSVAGPWGELHDTPGVWIGDASAFPTSSGVNPMITIMALAHRTAEAIAAGAGAEETSKTKAEVAL
jgi:choline dehydrogenase-like flavoprotein